MELIGTVVALQVQRSPLKPGPASTRVYDPSPLQPVVALDVGPRGCVGTAADGERVLDVHHADHPSSRNNRLANGLSFMTLAGYAHLRQTHGEHLVDGIAGESMLLDGELPLSGGVRVETVDDFLLLTDLLAAAPCVEFTRFCLRREPGAVDDEVLAALEGLGDGARGCYATAARGGVVRAGARVWRA